MVFGYGIYVDTYWFYMLHFIDGNKTALMQTNIIGPFLIKKLSSFANKLQYKAVYVKYIKVESLHLQCPPAHSTSVGIIFRLYTYRPVRYWHFYLEHILFLHDKFKCYCCWTETAMGYYCKILVLVSLSKTCTLQNGQE